ncbi:MAG: lmo0937 family membrane protein [Chitinophagaceae bacterium]
MMLLQQRLGRIMGNLIYVVVTVLLNTWIIAFLGFRSGNLIHVLLVMAFLIILFRVLNDKKKVASL